MENGDWLVRLLEQLQSTRLAVKVLVATAVFLLLVALERTTLLEVARTLQVAPWMLYAAAFFVCFAFGVVLVEGTLVSGRAVATRRRRLMLRKLEIAEQTSRLARQRDTVRDMLPSLSEHYHSVLQTLISRPTAEFLRTGELLYLEKAGAITLVAETSRTNGVFRLQSEVQELIRAYYNSEAERALTEALATLSPAEREFLELFGDPDPSEPEAPAHRVLSSECFGAGQSLVSKGVLARIDTNEASESFELRGSARPHLERSGAVRLVARNQLRIDLSRVDASGIGGSGAHP